MITLNELYENPDVPHGQVEYFWRQVKEILSVSQDKKVVALKSLHYMWQRYDSGGISMNRSLRCQLLDRVIDCINRDEVDNAKRAIAVLVAMYHDDKYIDKARWYDFPLNFGLYGSSLDERIHLSVVAITLGAENDIPGISDFIHQDFTAFLK
jgi:hypothetical protein